MCKTWQENLKLLWMCVIIIINNLLKNIPVFSFHQGYSSCWAWWHVHALDFCWIFLLMFLWSSKLHDFSCCYSECYRCGEKLQIITKKLHLNGDSWLDSCDHLTEHFWMDCVHSRAKFFLLLTFTTWWQWGGRKTKTEN